MVSLKDELFEMFIDVCDDDVFILLVIKRCKDSFRLMEGLGLVIYDVVVFLEKIPLLSFLIISV